MKLLLFILFPLVFVSPRYDQVFSHGYDYALQFLEDKSLIIGNILEDADNEKEIMVSVAFPELVRYSLLIDFFQEKAMEIIYIHYGKEKADFSFGYFQMKPSFIEKLESFIEKSEKLKEKYPAIYQYTDTLAIDIRKKRIERMKSVEWQLYYLKGFYAVMNEKFNHLIWKSTEEKIKFYAAAYNHDFNASKENIEFWMNKKLYPYGTSEDKNQYSYAKFSVYFYKNDWPRIHKRYKEKLECRK